MSFSIPLKLRTESLKPSLTEIVAKGHKQVFLL